MRKLTAAMNISLICMYYYLSKNTHRPTTPSLVIFPSSIEIIRSACSAMPVYVTAGRLPESPSEILWIFHTKKGAYSLGDTLRLELGERYWEDSKLNQNNPFLGEDEASGAEELRIREKREYTVVGF